MPTPVAIGGSLVGTQNSYHGSFKDGNDNIYTFMASSSFPNDTLINAMKATDPTSSFSLTGGVRADFGGTSGWSTLSLNVFQKTTNCHVAGQDQIHDVYYARFITSDGASNPDTWDDVDGAGNEEVLVDFTPNGAADACDIAVLSAAYGVGSAFVKIRVVYQGAVGMDMGSSYERVVESNSVDGGVNWSAPTSIDNSASVAGVDYTGPRIVLPPSNSDQTIVFMKSKEGTTHSFTLRAIAGDDTLRTYRNTGFSLAGPDYPITHGIGFNRSSVSKVRIGYKSGLNDLTVYEIDAFDDNSDPTTGDSISTVSTDNVAATDSIVACLAADGSIIRGLMAKDADDDLYEFSDDDADSYTLQGTAHRTGTVNHISCNVYDRSGPKLAMIYDDGGTVYYDEIDLGGGATTITVPQDSLSETDNDPVINTGATVETLQDSQTQTDNDPEIRTGVNVPVPQDSQTVTDNAPSVPQVVGVPQDSLSQTDNDPDIYTGATVGVPVDAQTQTDYDPGISTGASVPVPQDSQAVTDNAPTVPQIVGVPVDSLSVADQAPDIRTGATVVVPADAQTVTDNVPIIQTSIGVPQDSLTQTDNAPTIGAGIQIDVPQDSLLQGDNDPALNTGVTVEPPQDSLAQNDNAPAANTGVVILAPVDTLSVVDNDPVIATGLRVAVPTDGLSIADQVPQARTGVNVVISANDNLSLSTFAPVIIAVVVTTSGTRRQRQSKSLTRSRRRRR